MSPRQDERKPVGLDDILFCAVMLTLGLMLYISFTQDHHDLIKIMLVLGVLACLYIYKERGLRAHRGRLAQEVAEAQHQVDSLKRKVTANKVEVMKLEHQLQELNTLYRAIRSVNAVTDNENTFDAVLRAALELVGGDRGSLMLVDTERDTLTFASAVGLDDKILEGPGLRIGDRVAGWVAKQGEPVLLTGDLGENSPFDVTERQDGEMNVAMSVPLRLGDQIIGVLNVGSSVQADKLRFSGDDQRFAYLFAEHAAMAIDRAGGLGRMRQPTASNGTGDQGPPATSNNVRARTIDN
jgi:transcriptional regulator with GAF, ATPase, and Fis domain